LQWNNKSLNDYYAAWFQREVEIPLQWEKRRIFLEINSVLTDAYVYWNEQFVGESHSVSGAYIEITKNVKIKEKNIITILVKVQPDKETLDLTLKDVIDKLRGYPGGIYGDIYLESISLGTTISNDLDIVTDSQKGIATIKTVLIGDGIEKKVFVECLVIQGEKILGKSKSKIVSLSKGEKEVLVEQSMKGLQYWDVVNNPALYNIKLRLITNNGVLLDEKLIENVGFREITTKGNQFYLNGTPCRFRPIDYAHLDASPDYLSGYAVKDFIKNIKKLGHNAVYVGPAFRNRISPVTDVTELLKEADKNGWFLFGKLVSAQRKAGKGRIIFCIRHYSPNSPCPASCTWGSSCRTRGLPRGLASRLCPVADSIFA